MPKFEKNATKNTNCTKSISLLHVVKPKKCAGNLCCYAFCCFVVIGMNSEINVNILQEPFKILDLYYYNFN